MELPITTRHKIAVQFGIIKKGSTEVFNNTVKSDGYVIKDIEEALNVDAIQYYLEVNETDMLTLWMWMIDKIEGREFTRPNIDTTIAPISETDASLTEIGGATIIKPKPGRPAKKN